MRTLFLFLLLTVTVYGQSFIAPDNLGSNWTPSYKIKHDTLKEYIKEIGQKCDTTFIKSWKPKVKIDGVQYIELMMAPKDTCYIDTIWADKIAIYLTPKAAEKLRKDYEK